MTIRTIIAATLLSACWTQARATELTAQYLYDLCNKDGGAESLACSTYIMGFVDGVVTGPALSLDMTQGKVCLPPTIDGVAARKYAQKFMSENPEVLGLSARNALGVAMMSAFPCGATKK